MNDEIFSDLAIETAAHDVFGLKLEVGRMIVRDVPVSIVSSASVFLDTKKHLYAYISGQAPLVLGDIQKIIARMGLTAEEYLPPGDEPDYFNRIGTEKFREVFPSRTVTNPDYDLQYYRTLAPYNPALVRIARIKGGDIMGFVSESQDWRKVAEYSYARIKAD